VHDFSNLNTFVTLIAISTVLILYAVYSPVMLISVIQLGESCNSTAECAVTFTECSASTSTCQCSSGYYVDINGDCQQSMLNMVMNIH